jgi:hypothetical protein
LSQARVRSTTQRIGSTTKPLAWVRSLDGLYRKMWQVLCHSIGKLRSLVTSVSKELRQKRIHPEQRAQQQHTAIAVLDIRRMHDGVQQQS